MGAGIYNITLLLLGISINNVIEAISINNTGVVSIPAGILNYSTTSQVSTLITNGLSSYSNTTATNTLITNALSNYVSNSTLSNYSTTTQTNNLINSSVVTNQNIMSINFLTFVTSADFSSNVYNYNSLFQALMVDVGAANSGLGTFIQANSSNFTKGQFFYLQTCGSPTSYYIDFRDQNNLSVMFNSLGAFSNIGCPCNPNTTYKITYYNPSSNCPWYNSSSTSSSYMLQALTTNAIPVNSNISCVYY